jgi:hypothetical protein
MPIRGSVAALVLLLLIGASFAAVTLSNNNLECCSMWQSAIVVTKPDNTPIANCKVYMSVLETRGGIEITAGKYTYITDSKGQALLSYTPKKPGERVKISVSCEENRYENVLTVSGTGQNLPDIDFSPATMFLQELVDSGQIAIVVFLIFAVIVFLNWNKVSAVFAKKGPSKHSSGKHETAEEQEMAPRHLIFEHERKAAAKLAKKHPRKEVRLGHDFMRKL